MIALPPATFRRLQQLPQPAESVWEGDRRHLPVMLQDASDPDMESSECAIWLDGSEGMVRAMEMTPSETGHEALVRVLIKAMESPRAPSQPSRPRKIVVCDREIQFYLRGVLQDLDIEIEYHPALPLIDRLFDHINEQMGQSRPDLDPFYAEILAKAARKIWNVGPWDKLAEHQIVAIELNQWDIDRLYVSVLGMLGEEYGILLYRSLESLMQFRTAVVNRDSMGNLANAFLQQDCYFVTFHLKKESPLGALAETFFPLGELPWTHIEPDLGTIHPLEGLRPILASEEALAMMVALEAFSRFLKGAGARLDEDCFEAVSGRYRIGLPQESASGEKVSVKVETLPELAEELYEMMLAGGADDEDDDEDESSWPFARPVLRDDLIPDGSLCKLDLVSWEVYEQMRDRAKFYDAAPEEIVGKGEALPVAMVQTTRSKAKEIADLLDECDGLMGIGFTLGEDLYNDEEFDLGVLKTGDGDLHLFTQFERHGVDLKRRQRWEEGCDRTGGYCSLVVAMGATGKSRGKPQPKDIVVVIETKRLSDEDLDLGVLQRIHPILG